MPRYRLVFSRPVLETALFDVTHDRAEGSGGYAIERTIVQNPTSAVMLATREDEILLIRQFRLPPRKELWELPAGKCDPGETPLQTAKRELIEETGYRARRWRKLTVFYPAPGFCSERMHAFHAAELTEGKDAPESYERIRKRWVPRHEALRMIDKGSICDAKSMLTILLWDRLERA